MRTSFSIHSGFASKVILLIIVLVFTIFVWWQQQQQGILKNKILSTTYSTQFPYQSEDYLKLADINNTAFFTIINSDEEYLKFETFIESIQKNFISISCVRSVYIYHANNLSKTVTSRIKKIRFVRLQHLEPYLNLIPNATIPLIMESLLLEYSMVVYMGIGYQLSSNVLKDIFHYSSKYGYTAWLRDKNFKGNSHIWSADGDYALVAYTRLAYSKFLKPDLDYKRGALHYERKISDYNSKETIMHYEKLLYKEDPEKQSILLWKDKRPLDDPLLVEDFFYVIFPEESSDNTTGKNVIGLGIVVPEAENLDELINVRLNGLVFSLSEQDHETFTVIVYIILQSNSLINIEDLRQQVKHLKDIRDQIIIKIGRDLPTQFQGYQSDMAAVEAVRNNCDRYFNFGMGTNFPKHDRPWLKELFQNNIIHEPKLVIFTMICGEKDFWKVRELVGSVHKMLLERPMDNPPLIIIFGIQLEKSSMNLIQIWKHVKFQNINRVLYGIPLENHVDISDDFVKMSIFQSIFQNCDYALLIDYQVAFSNNEALSKIRSMISTQGELQGHMTSVSKIVLHGLSRETFKLKYCDVLGPLRINNYTLTSSVDAGLVFGMKSLPEEGSQYFCHLVLRPEIITNALRRVNDDDATYSEWGRPEIDAHIMNSSNKTKIAILIPSKTGNGKTAETVTLVQTLLKSFMKSILDSEWERFQYTLCIGYDEDDPILDISQLQLRKVIEGIVGERRESVLIKYCKMPTTKSVVWIWNLLFLKSVRDGNEYFYQINDDVEIRNSGWSTAFVDKLVANNNFGIVGPNDLAWNCKLLTQSFVSLTHFEIFGYYFPFEFKDWYSDNWITAVYGEGDTFCIRDHGIRNGAEGTRYQVCKEPRREETMAMGRYKISEWKSKQLVKQNS